jgi:hypothetical protein
MGNVCMCVLAWRRRTAHKGLVRHPSFCLPYLHDRLVEMHEPPKLAGCEAVQRVALAACCGRMTICVSCCTGCVYRQVHVSGGAPALSTMKGGKVEGHRCWNEPELFYLFALMGVFVYISYIGSSQSN